MNERIVVGIDVGSGGRISECTCRVGPDGTVTVIALDQYKASRTIDLKANKPDQKLLEGK